MSLRAGLITNFNEPVNQVSGEKNGISYFMILMRITYHIFYKVVFVL